MYLLVVTTLVVAMIGIYTQVLAIQTARIAANQTSLANTMEVWQEAAASMAKSVIQTNYAAYLAVSATGCSLTYGMSTAGYGYPASCPPTLNGGSIDPNGGVVVKSNGLPSLIYNPAGYNECVHLPVTCTTPIAPSGCSACTTSYNTANYQFYSLLFRVGSQDYVATFVPPPTISAANPEPGFVTLPGPGGTQLSFTISDLLEQIQKTGVPNYGFGYVQSGTLTTSNFQYTLPASIPSGSIALIGTPY